MVSTLRTAALVTGLVVAAAVASGCGDEATPWAKGSGSKEPVSVAPAATTVPNEPSMATSPADAPSPAGTSPDGSTVVGTTTDDTASQAVKDDRAAMVDIRTAVSIIEGCHSGRPSYLDCDEQAELGARDEIGITFGSGTGEANVAATPKSIRVTIRSKSGARFTVARSPKGDRFSCAPGPQPGACPDTGTWTW